MMAVVPMAMVKTRTSRDLLPWALSVSVVFVSIAVAVAGVANVVVALSAVVLMIRALAIAHLPPTPLLLPSFPLLERLLLLRPLLTLLKLDFLWQLTRYPPFLLPVLVLHFFVALNFSMSSAILALSWITSPPMSSTWQRNDLKVSAY